MAFITVSSTISMGVRATIASSAAIAIALGCVGISTATVVGTVVTVVVAGTGFPVASFRSTSVSVAVSVGTCIAVSSAACLLATGTASISTLVGFAGASGFPGTAASLVVIIVVVGMTVLDRSILAIQAVFALAQD